jgi:hypothetical protein
MALVVDELETGVADELRKHIDTCRICRDLYEAFADEEQMLRSAFDEVAATTEAMERNLIEQCDEHLGHRKISFGRAWGGLRTVSPIVKIATAAVIMIAVLFGVNQFGGSFDGASVVWAQVVKNVGKAKTVTFRLKTSMTGMPDSEIMVYDSSEYGSRLDLYVDGKITSRIYGPKDKNVSVMVIPEAKIYTRTSFTDQQRHQMHEREKDPREFVALFLSVDHTELGRRTIDGIEVEGLEVDSPKVGGGMFESAIGRLWVDVKTELPVRMEIEGVSASGQIQTQMVMDEFKWHEELEAGEFEPDIPADYTLQAETKMSDINEDKMIEGLQFFVQLTDGRYPNSLASMTADHELREAWQKKYDRGPTNEELDKFHKVSAACRFYANLLEGNKDVEYHGDKVTANDIDDELMRWKISENEYRVIYGDLRVETVVDRNKLLDLALKISGEKLPPHKRSKVLRILSLNEKDVIRGLGIWLELLDGRYPDSLEPEIARKQADSLLAAKYGIRNITDKKKIKEAEAETLDLFFASAFYNKLIREKKDVAYYGDKITVEDSGKVLMRWKISGGRYRVVFGNLTRKSITAEELAELEGTVLR